MQSLNSSIIYFPVVLITFQIIWRKFVLRCRKNEKGPIDFLMDFSHSFLSQNDNCWVDNDGFDDYDFGSLPCN